MKSLSRVQLLVTPWTAAYQAPPFMGFSRQEYWSGLPLPFPIFQLELTNSMPHLSSSTSSEMAATNHIWHMKYDYSELKYAVCMKYIQEFTDSIKQECKITLITLVVIINSQCVCMCMYTYIHISNHHTVHLKYIFLLIII